jgi:lysophospholipase L1-like esterase
MIQKMLQTSAMKPLRLLALLSVAVIAGPASGPAGEPVIKKGARLAIVGDSITEQKIYSKFIETYLLACTPQWEIQAFQFGWSGERAPGFASRQENDLAFWKPDIITTCFGMNDGEYRAYEESIGLTYEKGMRTIIDRFKKDGATFVVGGPGVVDSETFRREDPEFDKVYNDNLKQLDGIARKLADENGFNHADVFAVMMDVMARAKAALGAQYHVAGGDGVHPSANGQLVMAYAFLKGLGLDGEIARINLDWGNGSVETSEGHNAIESKDGSVTIESTRYPFCFSGAAGDPNSTASITPFLPFNDELNRFVFSVKNFPAQRAEVQWGDAKKEFGREDLEKGINLAAEFPQGPFNAPFDAVMNAVAQKQAFETPMIKDQITRLRFYAQTMPDDREVELATLVLKRKLQEKDDALYRAAKATVVPLRHTIIVRPLAG